MTFELSTLEDASLSRLVVETVNATGLGKVRNLPWRQAGKAFLLRNHQSCSLKVKVPWKLPEHFAILSLCDPGGALDPLKVGSSLSSGSADLPRGRGSKPATDIALASVDLTWAPGFLWSCFGLKFHRCYLVFLPNKQNTIQYTDGLFFFTIFVRIHH